VQREPEASGALQTGIVTHIAFAKVPDQRCTALLALALHASGTRGLLLAPA